MIRFISYFVIFAVPLKYPLYTLAFIIFIISFVGFIISLINTYNYKQLSKKNYYIYTALCLVFAISLIIIGVENYLSGTIVKPDVPKSYEQYTYHLEPIFIGAFVLLMIIGKAIYDYKRIWQNI